jgi:hypothetical protein
MHNALNENNHQAEQGHRDDGQQGEKILICGIYYGA